MQSVRIKLVNISLQWLLWNVGRLYFFLALKACLYPLYPWSHYFCPVLFPSLHKLYYFLFFFVYFICMWWLLSLSMTWSVNFSLILEEYLLKKTLTSSVLIFLSTCDTCQRTIPQVVFHSELYRMIIYRLTMDSWFSDQLCCVISFRKTPEWLLSLF